MPYDDLFEYVVWFRNESLPPDDEDHEWPGVIFIHAPDGEAALAWGDVLAQTCEDTFLWSKVEPWLDPVPNGNVVATHGQLLTAAQIGW